jgi:hypothetical protein
VDSVHGGPWIGPRQWLTGARPSGHSEPRQLAVRAATRRGRGGATGEPLTGAWTTARRRRDGGGASAQKGNGVGVAERRRGQADGVRVFHQGGGPCIGPGEGTGAVKAGNDRRQCLGLKAPVTGVFKSGGASFNGGMKEEATWHIFLFSGGGRGRCKVGCRRRLACSGSVREEEEEGRQVPWQAPSLRENVFPEICQGHARAKRAGEGRRQPRMEWGGTVKKEEGGRWGRVGQKGLAGLIKGRNKKGFNFQI